MIAFDPGRTLRRPENKIRRCWRGSLDRLRLGSAIWHGGQVDPRVHPALL